MSQDSDDTPVAGLAAYSKAMARAATVLSAAVLGAMALITTLDVLGRKLASISIPGSLDMTMLGLVATAYLGLGAAHLERRHVEFVMFTSRLTGRARDFAAYIRMLVMSSFLLLFVWVSTGKALDSFSRGETTNGMMPLLIWPARVVIAVSVLIYLSLIVADLIGRIRATKQAS